MPRLMLGCLFIIAATGCQESHSVTMPPEEKLVRVDLVIALQPHPEGGLEIRAQATNSGNVTVYFSGSCTSPGIDFRFSDSEGKEVFLFCSCGPLLYVPCPAWFGPLKPGENIENGNGFNGRLWNGTAYVPAPPGKYVVQATFRYSPALPGATVQSVISEAAFDWKAEL
jgi:hypothetical protein